MAKNGLKGDVGSYAHTTMDDAFWIVGTEPNTYPTARIEDAGRELVNLSPNKASGITNGKTAIPKYEEIDNSSDHHGGTFSFVCMNNFNVDAGGGGINLNTCGNVSIIGSGGLANIIAPLQTTIASDVIEIASTNTIVLSGKQLYVESEKNTFKNNAFFNKNVVVNGGMFVNGELYASHITAPCQTRFSSSQLASPSGPEMHCFMKFGTLISGMLAAPVPIEGLGVISAGTPISITVTTPTRIGTMPPHRHSYVTPGFSGAGSPSEFAEGAASIFSETPVEAKPTYIDDKPPGDQKSEVAGLVRKSINNYWENLLKP